MTPEQEKAKAAADQKMVEFEEQAIGVVDKAIDAGKSDAIVALHKRIAELEAALAHLLEFADSTGQGCSKQVEDARAALRGQS